MRDSLLVRFQEHMSKSTALKPLLNYLAFARSSRNAAQSRRHKKVFAIAQTAYRVGQAGPTYEPTRWGG
jgi:hypothetical protein